MNRTPLHPDDTHRRTGRFTTVAYLAVVAALAWGVYGNAHLGPANPSASATVAAPPPAPAPSRLLSTVPDASEVLPAATIRDEPEIATYGG